MYMKKLLVLLGAMVLTVLALAACVGPQGEPGPAGPAGVFNPEDMTCIQCHNETTLIVSKQAQFEEASVHGTGEAFLRGETTACAGCHGSEGAKLRINAGLLPHDPSVAGVVNVSPFNCRTCHNIHTTYTIDDFALTGSGQPVKMEYSDGTFDGGRGNLCANCHQIRNPKPEFSAGSLSITSSRYGTHYGTEAQMLLGVGGLGDVTGSPSAHYSMVTDTCVACHMGEESNHTYQPKATRCTACHADATNFDINGVQTEVEEMLEELHTLFVDKGLLNPETDLWKASSSAPLVVPEAVAQAMWNYKFVTYDASMGVHNAAYAEALLESALETMRAYTP